MSKGRSFFGEFDFQNLFYKNLKVCSYTTKKIPLVGKILSKFGVNPLKKPLDPSF
jgi:hypothetical protein